MQRFFAVDGQLVLPGLVDMHQHLDKSRTRALLDNPSGTLIGASAAYRALAPSITKEQMIARARRTVEACSAHGTVAIRSHTNIDPQTGVRGVEAMVELRAQCAAFMHIQIVGHVTSGATSMLPESDAWLREAIDLGIDAIGGVPAFSSEPARVAEAAVRQRRAQRACRSTCTSTNISTPAERCSAKSPG